MASYFLKQCKHGSAVYLSIVDGYYCPETQESKQTTVKKIGRLDKAIKAGIADPIAHYKEVAAQMNADRAAKEKEQAAQEAAKKKEAEALRITDRPLLFHMGYFPLACILDKLNVRKEFRAYGVAYETDYDLYEMMRALIFSRVVMPCSKLKTTQRVFPELFHETPYSYSQVLDATAFFGKHYKQIAEIFRTKTAETYGIDTSLTYFDTTNFYFEIDLEDNLRRKGPSKENRRNPIVGLGLLLDAELIPINLKLFPGNQSEKPVLRETLKELRKESRTNGKTVRVADKGLNCAANIIDAVENGDGYIFSKSVKVLSEREQNEVLNSPFTEVRDAGGKLLYEFYSYIADYTYSEKDENGKKKAVTVKEKRLVTYNPSLARKQRIEIRKLADKALNMTVSEAKLEEYGERAKYVNFEGNDGEKAIPVLRQDRIDRDKELAGYNMIVTSEAGMPDEEIYSKYHNLWRIEESFKILKSDLEARPVYLQKEETITGHFLICYLAVLLTRLFQFKVLKDKFSSSEIFNFMRDFKAVKLDEKKNMSTVAPQPLLYYLQDKYNLPLDYVYLQDEQIDSFFKCDM